MSLGLSQTSLLLVLLGGAALILYFAGRFAMGQIPARVDGSGVRAWLAAMPVIIVSLVTIAFDRTQLGLHLPVACAAAAMTFGLGVVLAGRPAPKPPIEGAAPAGGRSWPLVLPAIALVAIAAQGGTLVPWTLAILALFGSLALAGWQPDLRVAMPHDGHATPSKQDRSGPAIAVWTGAAIATAVAAGMAVAGLPALEQVRQMPSDALATVFLIAPAIVVPMCFELLPPCRPIGWAASISSLSRFAVICLCVALPLAALAAAARPAVATYYGLTGVKRIVTAPTTTPAAPALFPTSQATTAPTPPPPTTAAAPTPKVGPLTMRFVSLPAVTQRADLIVVAGASLLLLPLSSGRLRPGKRESAALIGVYLFYLILVMAMVVR